MSAEGFFLEEEKINLCYSTDCYCNCNSEILCGNHPYKGTQCNNSPPHQMVAVSHEKVHVSSPGIRHNEVHGNIK